MLLHHLQAAFLSILSLAIAGYFSWSAANVPTQDVADRDLSVAPTVVAATPVPVYTPAPEQFVGEAQLEAQEPFITPQPDRASEAGPELAVAPVSRAVLEVEASLVEKNPEALDYFSEIGFGVEYGNSAPVLHKWTEDVHIKVHGDPTSDDLDTLGQVVDELNALISAINLQLTDKEGNIDIYFAPESHFPSIEPGYVPVNLGFFRVWWDGSGGVYRAKILIASQGITQQERSHLIREELTQSLGLFKDSWKHPESIFYQGWTDTTAYSSLDRTSISLLYNPQLQPGMTPSEALAVLSAAACCAD